LDPLFGKHDKLRTAPFSNLRGANPSEAVNDPLPTLLAKYREACAENRLTDAQALAAKALLLDPACFGK
jgi:hypothetical protein